MLPTERGDLTLLPGGVQLDLVHGRPLAGFLMQVAPKCSGRKLHTPSVRTRPSSRRRTNAFPRLPRNASRTAWANGSYTCPHTQAAAGRSDGRTPSARCHNPCSESRSLVVTHRSRRRSPRGISGIHQRTAHATLMCCSRRRHRYDGIRRRAPIRPPGSRPSSSMRSTPRPTCGISVPSCRRIIGTGGRVLSRSSELLHRTSAPRTITPPPQHTQAMLQDAADASPSRGNRVIDQNDIRTGCGDGLQFIGESAHAEQRKRFPCAPHDANRPHRHAPPAHAAHWPPPAPSRTCIPRILSHGRRH